jgi:hypothetical protein
MTFARTGWARIYLQTVTKQPGFHDIIHGSQRNIYRETDTYLLRVGAWEAVEGKLRVA